jgi:hypothetical protein
LISEAFPLFCIRRQLPDDALILRIA